MTSMSMVMSLQDANRKQAEKIAALEAENARLREACGPKPAHADLGANVRTAMANLVVAVARLRSKHGRDAVRRLPWGTTLDAMDSGRTELHPDEPGDGP